jgi:hypothetical protein
MKQNWKLKARICELYGTQADGALVLGVNETILSKVIRGRRSLPETEMQRWAEVLDCTPEAIFPHHQG